MLMPHAGLKHCFEKVVEVTTAYNLLLPQGGRASLKSVYVLIEAIQASMDHKLTVIEGDTLISTTIARGYFLSHKDQGFVVCHLNGQNLCWNRLVLCKELFHVVLASDRNRSTDVAALLQNLLASFPDIQNYPLPAVVTEVEAEMGAMEFLFPYADRVAILNAGNHVSMTVAQRYKIPKMMVERYLSEQYMTNLKPFFE